MYVVVQSGMCHNILHVSLFVFYVGDKRKEKLIFDIFSRSQYCFTMRNVVVMKKFFWQSVEREKND